MPSPDDDTPTPDPDGALPPLRLSLALFLLSTATVLFTLALFKLLSFFIMPSLFFDLLFIGFPIGAFLAARFFRASSRSLRGTLWLLQCVMVVSVGATLLCKHFDYLRAHLFDVELHRLLVQMGTFTALFIPFFCAYGLTEYIGYRVGRRHLKGRMPVVYGLYLFGAAFAYVFLQLSLPTLGASRLLGLPLLLIAVAASLIARPGTARRWLIAEQVVLVLLLAAPLEPLLGVRLEGAFLRLYKGEGAQSTHDYRERDYELAFQRWGRYSLTEVMRSRETGRFAGFYNDLMQWEYAEPYGFAERGLGMIPINAAPRGGRIAIIGAGGGRQVRWALQPRFRFESIVALELEPAVFRAVRGPLARDFREVYGRIGEPRTGEETVVPILHEARSYMETSDETFDLIYLPSVGGYPQMMLEPGNMIRTLDAYRTLVDHLTERGILAIWYPRGLDPRSILTRQYIRTLQTDEVGLRVRAFWNRDDYLILATRPGGPVLPDLDDIAAFVDPPAAEAGNAVSPRLPPNPGARPEPFFVLPDPEFSPITDAQPFLAGNVRHIFSLGQLYTLFGLVAGSIAAAGALLLFFLRRSGDPGIPGRSFLQVAGLAFLIGANFLVFEHYVILALFRKLYVFHDALVLGAISFLVISGLGSILVTPRLRPACQLLGVLFVVTLAVAEPHLPLAGTLALLAPVAFVTGSFFPTLFEAAARNPLGVFAMDAVGAALGSGLAFFVPIAFGFHYFFPVAAAVFVATAAATWLFFRRGDAEPGDDTADIGRASAVSAGAERSGANRV